MFRAVRLFSNRSQMTSKCDKAKKAAHEAIGECVTDVLSRRFDVFCDLFSGQTHGNIESN